VAPAGPDDGVLAVEVDVGEPLDDDVERPQHQGVVAGGGGLEGEVGGELADDRLGVGDRLGRDPVGVPAGGLGEHCYPPGVGTPGPPLSFAARGGRGCWLVRSCAWPGPAAGDRRPPRRAGKRRPWTGPRWAPPHPWGETRAGRRPAAPGPPGGGR